MPNANEMLAGLKATAQAIDEYRNRMNLDGPINDKVLTMYDNLLGAVNHGKEGIRNYLASEEINELVNSINQQSKACIKLEVSPAKQAKMRLAATNLEASLKGFELPLEKNAAFDNLSYTGLEEKEILEKALPAVKEALIELNDQKISKDQYVKALIDKTQEILKKDSKITPEQLEKYKKFITQGDKSKNLVNKEFQQATIPEKSLELEENAKAAANKAKEAMDQNTMEAQKLTIENPYSAIDNKLNTGSKLANDNLKIKIEKDFAPLLESKNPALVNGTKKVLAELDPGYLTERGWGGNIALELQRVAKPKLWQRIVAVVTGTDYAQINIDKAVANFKESSILYKNAKNLPEELKKEEQARAEQKQDKGINIVEKKEPDKAKTQGYKSSISTPKELSHVNALNESRQSQKKHGPTRS